MENYRKKKPCEMGQGCNTDSGLGPTEDQKQNQAAARGGDLVRVLKKGATRERNFG